MDKQATERSDLTRRLIPRPVADPSKWLAAARNGTALDDSVMVTPTQSRSHPTHADVGVSKTMSPGDRLTRHSVMWRLQEICYPMLDPAYDELTRLIEEGALRKTPGSSSDEPSALDHHVLMIALRDWVGRKEQRARFGNEAAKKAYDAIDEELNKERFPERLRLAESRGVQAESASESQQVEFSATDSTEVLGSDGDDSPAATSGARDKRGAGSRERRSPLKIWRSLSLRKRREQG